MTHGALRVSAIALGVAAVVSLSPLSVASADSSAPSGATSTPNATAPATSGATPSVSEPASTPSVATSPPSGATSTPSGTASTPGGAPPASSEATSTGSGATAVQRPPHAYVHHYAHYYTRHTHYAWRNGRRYVYYSYDRNPVAAAARGVVGSAADLGSLAAYPIYCFPSYGSCPVYWPYR